MKTVILCGGFGTRLGEETHIKPKPMVQIGAMPIVWHIMKIYDVAGFTDFVLALGYKGDVIKEYFLNYNALTSDIRLDLGGGGVSYTNTKAEDWRIDLVDTGARSMTGGRLHRLQQDLRHGGTFMVTYGDGVADLDIAALLAFHRAHGRLATITAVRPPARFGTMNFDGDRVTDFQEKPQTGEGWINGGFFVFEPPVFEYLTGDDTILEREPLEGLARDGQLMAFRHDGFWQCMDTLRDRQTLEDAWAAGRAAWKIWD